MPREVGFLHDAQGFSRFPKSIMEEAGPFLILREGWRGWMDGSRGRSAYHTSDDTDGVSGLHCLVENVAYKVGLTIHFLMIHLVDQV